MAGDTTKQMLSRLTWIPDREATDNGELIAGQSYDDVYFAGGTIENVELVNVTHTGNFAVTGNITATGTITGSNLSGTNTGDQTITLTGDVTGSGTGSFATTLATVNANVGTFGSASQIPTFTVDAKGRITAASQQDVSISIDNSGFEVLTGDNPQTLWEECDEALLKARGTEVLSGAAVTFTVGTTVFDVGATVGQIKDSSGYYAIDYAGASGVSVISTSDPSIYVYIDNAGALQQQTTEPTADEFRSKLFITRLAFSGGTLAAQESLVNPSGQYTNTIRDYLSYVASPKKGLALSGNASLTFQVASGSIFELGTNFANDEDNPNEVSFSAQNPTTFFYVKRDATIATGQTSINVTQYDNGGTLTTMTNNRFKIMTVYKFNSGNHVVQEGQAQYTSLDEAQTAISTRTFVQSPLVANGTRLGWVIVQKNATDLTNTSAARFVQDNGSFSTAVGSVGALLASNNLSDLSSVSTARANLDVYSTSEVDALIPTALSWTTYTPTYTGLGTVSGSNVRYCRDGAVLHISGYVTSGTATATEARISLPSGLEALTGIHSPSVVGNVALNLNLTGACYLLAEPETNYLTVSVSSSSTAALTKANGNDFSASGRNISFSATIPIQDA